MDEQRAVGEQPERDRADALRAAVIRAERGEGTAEDAYELAGLARWLWEQFAEPLSARDAALYYATNAPLFAPQTDEEARADALLRRLLGGAGPGSG
jgi:hypothetical protein